MVGFQLGSVLREYLDRHAPLRTALSDDDRTAAFLRAFQPGGLLVPEELGGAGATVADAAVVAAESARALLDGGVLSQLLAAAVIAWAPPGTGRDELLAGIAASVTSAWPGPSSPRSRSPERGAAWN
jgi:alkylation response protein AidB-like acyl-CoA dehydrogenase